MRLGLAALIIGTALSAITYLPYQPYPPTTLQTYAIAAVPLTSVTLTDSFWAPRLERNRTVTIPHILRENEIAGRVDNFLKAAHKLPGAFKGHRYDDTDIYKIIEAASDSLAVHPDPVLDRKIDELIALVAAAQEPDGYVYAARTADPEHPAPGAGPERWAWLHTSHELYNQGHLYEAAVAHFQATGKRSLLNVALKSADLVCRTFGPSGRRDVPGHEEIELALIKLWRATGERKYADQAKYFLDQRGRPHEPPLHEFPPGDPFAMYNDRTYRQDHTPVAEQTRAVGHAVRATYLYSGMTDASTLFADSALGRAVDALYRDVTAKRMYITGGLGARGGTEAFDDDYVLPNRAYAETCASIGGMLWYHRMFLREGDGAYYDTFERTLYNGYLSGVSLSGDRFFYQNPLVSNGRIERAEYFEVACCPANLARLMAQLPGLVYAQRNNEVFVNLFIGSRADIRTPTSHVVVAQRTEYPWDGRVTLHVDPDSPAELTLAVRIPGWARGEASPGGLYRFARAASRPDAPRAALRVNGKALALTVDHGYARITRRWTKGDVVDLELPMPIERVLANDAVVDDRGAAAIERGPIVYCVEDADNSAGVAAVRLALDANLRHHVDPHLLGGVDVVTGPGVVAVPYFAWNNRGKGGMAVWIPY